MSARLVLYFTGTEHVLYRSEGGSLVLEGQFGGDEAGVDAFRAALRRHPNALVSVLADLAGEDFHEDQIPFLRGNDRQAVVQRRLSQRYRDSRLATALPLGYTSDGRKSEKLLLASFTNTQQFAPWMDAIADAGVRLAGVYSAPLLAPALAARAGVKSGRAFVITVNGAGLRQSFVEDGRLRFARLERTADTVSPEALAAFVRAESLRLAQYLSTLRTLPREGPPVQAVVIVPAAQRSVFEQALVSDGRLAFVTVAKEDVARKAGLKRLAPEAGSEQLYLHLTIRQAPRDQFARGEERRGYLLWRLQRWLYAGGAAAFGACLVYAGLQWLELYGLRDQTAAQTREAVEAAQRYQRITSTFPVTQTTTENLKAAVIEFTRIAGQSASPEGALVYASQVLDKFPQMELQSIAWSVGKPPAIPEAPKPAAPAAPGAAPAPGTPAGGEVYQMLEVSGQVNATRRSDYRGITGQVQTFAEALRVDPAWRILKTQLPFDVTPEGTLSGDIGSGEGTDAPRFTIVIGRPVK